MLSANFAFGSLVSVACLPEPAEPEPAAARAASCCCLTQCSRGWGLAWRT